MKTFRRTLGFLILTILFFNNSLAQKATYTTNGGMIIGFGAGKTYQKSDLLNSNGFGLDFILGSQLYNKEDAFLSVDWKFRFLAGQNKAYDNRINPDNTYSNIRYSFFNYDLELGLTMNRLRERTRIILTGFLGAGITHGRTFTDLYDAGNNLYDYSSIDPSRDSKVVHEDLLALSDGDFETHLINKASILPTAGIFIGYQFSRSLSAGIEYKTNFYLTENNSLVGINLDNKILDGSGIDRNNYVSLGFRWKLRVGSSTGSTTGSSSPGTTHNYRNNNRTNHTLAPVSLPRPTVDITDPSGNPYHTLSYNHTIRAKINNVKGADDLSFYQNGFPNNSFTYNAATNVFTASVRLQAGENKIRIRATNLTSSAEDMTIITLDDPPEIDKPAPRVWFTSPSTNQVTVSSDRITVTASTKNISSEQDIQFTVNGNKTSFKYNPVSGLVTTSVILIKGENIFLIEGFNESGSAKDQLSVYFNTPELPLFPTVRFINPASPLEVEYNRFQLEAETQNVSLRNKVSLKLNGTSINNFSFSTTGRVSVNLFLSEGVNTIEITARNESGFASERTHISYFKPEVRSSPPAINIISPASYRFRTYVQTEEMTATVLNVNSKESITLNINGSNTRNFNFNNNTKVLTTRVALREGENVVSIYAQNVSGSDVKDRIFIKETRPCPLPLVRLIAPDREQSNTGKQIYAFRAEVQNIANSNQLRLIVNGKPVSFSFSNNIISSSLTLANGPNTLSLNARNMCGEDKAFVQISYNPRQAPVPCSLPTVNFTMNEVNRADATHELRGAVTGARNKADISLSLDGKAVNSFQFVPPTGELSAKYKLTPGAHTVLVRVSNACGTDNKSVAITLEEESCGIRINPGNSSWQFCMISPSGTYSRENLTDKNFSYSGPATSLYFMPIGGGGNATVKGRPYTIKSGQYYLFTGKLNVSISTKNPGSMGHWSVCISSDKEPVSGNGNSRPKSPCEVEEDNSPKGKGKR